MSLSCCHTTWCCGYLGLINHGTLNGPRLSYWRKCRLHKAKSKQTFNSELIRYTSISFTFLINCNVMLVIRTFLKNKQQATYRISRCISQVILLSGRLLEKVAYFPLINRAWLIPGNNLYVEKYCSSWFLEITSFFMQLLLFHMSVETKLFFLICTRFVSIQCELWRLQGHVYMFRFLHWILIYKDNQRWLGYSASVFLTIKYKNFGKLVPI